MCSDKGQNIKIFYSNATFKIQKTEKHKPYLAIAISRILDNIDTLNICVSMWVGLCMFKESVIGSHIADVCPAIAFFRLPADVPVRLGVLTGTLQTQNVPDHSYEVLSFNILPADSS